MTVPKKQRFTKGEIQVGFLRFKNWKIVTIANFLDIPVEDVKAVLKSLTDKIETIEDSNNFRERLDQIEAKII